MYAGDGGAYATVKFRMIVFKPFVGELLVGSIKSMDANGILVTLNFFDQVLVPPELMNPDCEWSGQNWYWRFGEHKLHMAVQDHIRLRISNVVFNPPESKRYGPHSPFFEFLSFRFPMLTCHRLPPFEQRTCWRQTSSCRSTRRNKTR